MAKRRKRKRTKAVTHIVTVGDGKERTFQQTVKSRPKKKKAKKKKAKKKGQRRTRQSNWPF